MVNETEFLFFFSSGRWTATIEKIARGVGDGGARDCERGPLRDVASLLSVQNFNIKVCLYTDVYWSFDDHSGINLTIFESKSDS